LINPKFEKKFLETLTMIKNNDPKLKENSKAVFGDSDFEDDVEEKVEKKERPYTYKD
jgi:protein KRI1